MTSDTPRPPMTQSEPVLTAEERFWAKVDRRGPDECWEWKGGRNPKGYGRYRFGSGPAQQAHRIAYELVIGRIPEGLVIDHLCRNHGCVNPAHLEPVTYRENVMRGVSFAVANSRKTHCPSGHPYSPENTVIGRQGDRRCRICYKYKGGYAAERAWAKAS